MQDRIDRSHSEQPGLQTGVKGASKSAVADFDAFLDQSRASPTSVRRRRVYPLTALQPRLWGIQAINAVLHLYPRLPRRAGDRPG